jgi:hypothetical protein
MSDDPLDKKVSVGAELTESGLNVNATSRAVAAVDRLIGNMVDWFNLPVEGSNVRARTKIEGERQLMDAMRNHAIDRMKTDREFADRAVDNYLRSIGFRQENRDAVARLAIEDLRRDPRATAGGQALTPDFMNKLERHAEDAASEEAREKWGRVLAAEIRKPGTITPRGMRLIDELDSNAAKMFEDLCKHRIGATVPTCLLAGKLAFKIQQPLVEAGLLAEPGPHGHESESRVVEEAGNPRRIFILGEYAFSTFPDAFRGPHNWAAPLISASPDDVSVPVYLLTSDGYAVAQFLPDEQSAAFDRYMAVVRTVVEAEIVSIAEAVRLIGPQLSANRS